MARQRASLDETTGITSGSTLSKKMAIITGLATKTVFLAHGQLLAYGESIASRTKNIEA